LINRQKGNKLWDRREEEAKGGENRFLKEREMLSVRSTIACANAATRASVAASAATPSTVWR
jgi:hypothetical protein